MLLHRTLPYAAILLVGQAILDAGPGIVAEREGGMGLGSALIAASVTQLAGIVVGAVLGGPVADRRPAAVAPVTGALLCYAGLLVTGIAPMGSLATVVTGMGIAGIGFGVLLAAAFADAATLAVPRDRAMAMGLLLAAPIAARLVAGTAFILGPAAFVAAGATVVGLAILVVRLPDGATREHAPSGRASAAGSVGRSVLAAAMLGLGTLLSVAAADPSRLSASLLVGIVGSTAIETLDAARAAMALIGVTLILAGAATLLSGGERVTRVAAPALALIAFAGAGMTAALTQALTAGRPPDGAAAVIGAIGTLAGLAGLALGGALAVGPRGPWFPLATGGATLVSTCAAGWLLLLGQRPEPATIAPILLVGLVAFAVGVAAVALRLALADVHPTRRGRAAGAGVAAVGVGAAVGGLLGAGEGVAVVTGAPGGAGIALVGFVLAAVAATVLSAPLREARGTDASTAAEGRS